MCCTRTKLTKPNGFQRAVLQPSGKPKGTSTNPVIYMSLKLLMKNEPWYMQDREKLVPNVHHNPARSQFARLAVRAAEMEPDRPANHGLFAACL